MPDWVINAAVIVTGMGVAFGALRSTVDDLKKRLDAIQTTASDTSARLVKLESRLDASDSLRLDERMRALEMAQVRHEARQNAGNAV